MKTFSDEDEFMAGLYIVKFDSEEKLDEFVETYSDCPLWPIIQRREKGDEALVFALELKRQKHGDFSQEDNALASHPEWLGAQEIEFIRDDELFKLVDDHELKTGYSDTIPCGSSCESCPRFKDPCRGCPAYYEY